MKKATNILKLASCILVSIYTLLMCRYTFNTAWSLCQKFMVKDGGLVLAFGGVTSEAIPYFIFAAVLLLLGVATALSLFRRAWIWSVIAGIETLALALTGIALNTDLAEISMLTYIFPSADHAAILRIMPSFAILCVCLVAAYAVLCVVAARKQPSESVEDNSSGNF